MKNLVYETPVQSEKDLVAKVAVAAERYSSGLNNIISFFIEVGGSHFEQLLKT